MGSILSQTHPNVTTKDKIKYLKSNHMLKDSLEQSEQSFWETYGLDKVQMLDQWSEIPET
jgi:hypothetical protein